MAWGRYFGTIVFGLFLIFRTASVYAVDCNNGTGVYTLPGDIDCNGECPALGLTCEADDDDPNRLCCFDLAAVPELPSWFGPFFLATLVAAFEYWRVHRRKTLKVHAAKRETGR